MAKQQSTTNSRGKKQSKSRAKRGPKRLQKLPIYRASSGGSAKVSPAKKFGRDTKKAKSFEKIVSLVRVQQDATRTSLERGASGKCAENMCKRHGIDFSDVTDHIEYSKNKYQSDCSTVLIKHSNKNKDTSVRTQTFLIDLCDAIEMMFHCSAYTELKKGVLRVTFYGIASNTLSAQLAFKTCYNQIGVMSMAYKGPGPRNSYLLGISAGFWNRAMHRKLAFEDDLQKAKDIRATTFANEDFEDDEDYEPDFNFDAVPHGKEEPDTAGDTIKNETAEGSSMALVRLGDKGAEEENDGDNEEDEDEDSDEDNDNSEGSYNWVQRILAHKEYCEKVEETGAAWLKSKGIKLNAMRKRPRNIRHPEEFAQGEEDSNDIDLGEKRIDAILQHDLESPAEEDNEDEDDETSS